MIKIHLEPSKELIAMGIQAPPYSLRLDSVLAVGFSISRSKASQLIASGRCAVN